MNVKLGDRVAWMGGKPGTFGRETVRWTGTVVALGCGVPYYDDPIEFTSDGHAREAGRRPAVKVRIDIPQHGETRLNYFSDVVVENSKLLPVE